MVSFSFPQFQLFLSFCMTFDTSMTPPPWHPPPCGLPPPWPVCGPLLATTRRITTWTPPSDWSTLLRSPIMTRIMSPPPYLTMTMTIQKIMMDWLHSKELQWRLKSDGNIRSWRTKTWKWVSCSHPRLWYSWLPIPLWVLWPIGSVTAFLCSWDLSSCSFPL